MWLEYEHTDQLTSRDNATIDRKYKNFNFNSRLLLLSLILFFFIFVLIGTWETNKGGGGINRLCIFLGRLSLIILLVSAKRQNFSNSIWANSRWVLGRIGTTTPLIFSKIFPIEKRKRFSTFLLEVQLCYCLWHFSLERMKISTCIKKVNKGLVHQVDKSFSWRKNKSKPFGFISESN